MVVDPLEVALEVVGIFDQLGIRYLIGGSLASSLHGEIRSTLDVDFVVEIQPNQVEPLFAAVTDRFYASRDAIRDAVRFHHSFNLIHLDSMVKVDVYVPPDSAVHQSEMARARREEISGDPKRAAIIASPEDVVLFKLDWYRQGGGVSERQWRDVLGVLRVQRERLDLAYLRHWSAPLGVTDLLEQALREAGLGA